MKQSPIQGSSFQHMFGWHSGIDIWHLWLVLWVQFLLEATLFLLKLFKTLDVKFVQRCQKCQICVENENLEWLELINSCANQFHLRNCFYFTFVNTEKTANNTNDTHDVTTMEPVTTAATTSQDIVIGGDGVNSTGLCILRKCTPVFSR